MTERETEVLRRFGREKVAIDPALLAILGTGAGLYGGHLLAPRLPPGADKAIQGMLGATGAYLGKTVGDAWNKSPQQQVPQGSPYTLDPTDQDIPSWALQGARYLQPSMKTGRANAWYDPIASEVPGYGFVEGARHGGGTSGALKGGLGSIGGGVLGAGAGLLAGKGLSALLGERASREIPGIHMNLSEILSGLGGTIGATSGFRHAVG